MQESEEVPLLILRGPEREHGVKSLDKDSETIKYEILKKIQGIENLPPFPDIINRLNAEMNKESIDLTAVSRIIETDPSLTAHFLRLVNTAFYAPVDGRFTTVQQALVRLGVPETRKICMTFAAMKIFESPSGLVDHKKFWKHCISTALMSQSLVASRRPVKDKNMIFTAGLLHDMGIYILDIYFPEYYAKVREVAEKEQRQVHEVEKELLGMDHGEISSLLLAKWGLPEVIYDAVEFHHEPDRCPQETKWLCQVVHLSEFIVSDQGLSEPGDIFPTKSSEGAWYDLGVEIDEMIELLDKVVSEIDKTEAFINS